MAIERILGTDTRKTAFEKTDRNFVAQEGAINELAVLAGIGGIAESGSNENGSYVKFNDGTMICFGSYAESITTTLYGVTHMMESAAHSYPVEFTTNYKVFISCNGGDFIGAGCYNLTLTTFLVRYHFANAALNQSMSFSFFAIGRWKA